MSKILSKTMSLVAVALLIHFIIISAYAGHESADLSREIDQEVSSSPSALLRDLKYHNGHKVKGIRSNHPKHGHSHVSRGRPQRSFRGEIIGLLDEGAAGLPNLTPFVSPSFSGASSSASASAGSKAADKPYSSEPLFMTENSTVVVAQIGSTAILPCIVKNLGHGVASWMRRRDYSLLTVGIGTINHDDRFYVSYSRITQNWELNIKYAKQKDEGEYECQISTHPPSSIFVTLQIVEARAEILGEPDKHVRSGSTFELICVLRDSTEPPVFVFWYHNERMINYDKQRGVIVNSDAEKSVLMIEDAQKTDSGNYSCVPSNARPSSITVHILNGEKPAAMYHGSVNNSVHTSAIKGWMVYMGFALSLWFFVRDSCVVPLTINFISCDRSSYSKSSSSRSKLCKISQATSRTSSINVYLAKYVKSISNACAGYTDILCSNLALRLKPVHTTISNR